MSSTKKYNTIYSAADIEKYLRGELPPREMHDLENAALEDPFLADALDGMSTLPSGLGSDLDELHARLKARVAAVPDRDNIRRAIPRWSIAASIILLLGIGSIVYYTFLTGGRSKIVAPAPSTPASSSPVAAASPPPAETTVPAEPPPPAPAALAEQPLVARSKAPAPAPERIEEYKIRHEAPPSVKDKADADAEADTVAGTSATAGIATNPPTAPSGQLEGRAGGPTLDSPARISMANALYKRAANSLVFSGRVLDNHDNPVPGASLILKGNRNAGTVTDQQGQFKLYLPPQDSSRYLMVAMIGYGQKSFPLSTLAADNITGHVIHLQPNDAALNEVVVTGYGIKRKETLATAPSTSEEELDSLWQKARPVIGKAAYLYYLDTAQKTLAMDSSITGTETVSFEVDKKGTLTSFKIEQSLSPAHDEAIIRLVKEGPAWQLLKQKKVRATVSLHF
jgi:outer membrane biosynthesis protein TonB